MMRNIIVAILCFVATTLFITPGITAETPPHKIPWIKHKATIDPSGGIHEIEFGPNGKYLGTKRYGHIRIYDLSSADTITHKQLSGQRAGEELTYDGLVIGPKAEKFFVAAGYYTPGFLGSHHSAGWVEVYDLQTGEKLNKIAHHDWDLTSLSSGPNRRFFVSTDHVDDVVIWDNQEKNSYRYYLCRMGGIILEKQNFIHQILLYFSYKIITRYIFTKYILLQQITPRLIHY